MRSKFLSVPTLAASPAALEVAADQTLGMALLSAVVEPRGPQDTQWRTRPPFDLDPSTGAAIGQAWIGALRDEAPKRSGTFRIACRQRAGIQLEPVAGVAVGSSLPPTA